MKTDSVWLMHGDCLRLLRDVPDRSVNMVLCDLPYGTTQNKWDCVLDLEALWKEYKRVCTGAIVLTAQTPFDKTLGASNLEMLRYEWIWEKTEATGHMNAKRAPMKAHENLLVFYAQQPTYNPIKTAGHARKTAVKRGDVSTIYGAQKFDAIPYDSTERYPRSVLIGPTDKQRLNLHPAQKPLWLMEYMVRTYTNEGDTVLDNCMGSGTTGVACINSGRRFIGMELDVAHSEAAGKRIYTALQESGG
jgi:DNA modification methylase